MRQVDYDPGPIAILKGAVPAGALVSVHGAHLVSEGPEDREQTNGRRGSIPVPTGVEILRVPPSAQPAS